MPPMNALFEASYGHKLDLNKLLRDPNGINFVGRTGRNNGVTAKVAPVPGLPPHPGGALTVALGGSILSTFLQSEPFYTAQNVAVLVPKRPMTAQVLLYYAAAIAANRFRYGAFGREANRTFRSLEIPDLTEVPAWVKEANPDQFAGKDRPALATAASLYDLEQFPQRTVEEVFRIEYGHSLELNRLRQVPAGEGVPFVSRKSGDNGIAAYVQRIGGIDPNPAGDLTVALSGNGVLSTFLQERPYYTAFHVACLRPRTPISRWGLIYLATCIYANKYRFNYGRQANRTLGSLLIPVPSGPAGWASVEAVMRSLPYSAEVERGWREPAET